MPSIFKALASIIAWTLFISGFIWLVVGAVVTPVMAGVLFAGSAPPWTFHAAWVVSVTILTLAVVVMRLRKGLE